MKKLEDRIIDKVYGYETRKTASYVVSRILLGFLFVAAAYVLGSAMFEVLAEQGSFDLVGFFAEDLEAARRYFLSNVADFMGEIPQPLGAALVLTVAVLFMLVLIISRNFYKITNRIRAIIRFRKRKISRK